MCFFVHVSGHLRLSYFVRNRSTSTLLQLHSKVVSEAMPAQQLIQLPTLFACAHHPPGLSVFCLFDGGSPAAGRS